MTDRTFANDLAASSGMRPNRVPQVTPDFWLIKLMAVTMGETGADYLAVNLGLGLAATSVIMTAVLVLALLLQFSRRRYVPWTYWLAVVLISIVGTLVTDNLVDNLGVSLVTSTIGFTLALALTFWVWFRSEGTLSIHTIITARREAFYWLAILFTFALGTAAGDLVAEQFGLGYLATGILFGSIIVSLSIGYFWLGLDGILGLLAGLHLHPAARRLVRRSAVAAFGLRRARFRNHRDEPHLRRRDRRGGRMDDVQPRRRRTCCSRIGAGTSRLGTRSDNRCNIWLASPPERACPCP